MNELVLRENKGGAAIFRFVGNIVIGQISGAQS